MKAFLLTVGRAKPPFIEAEAHYLKLLRHHQPLEVVAARDDDDLIRRLPARGRIIGMDTGGQGMDSITWSNWLDERRIDALDICFLVGGQKGLPAEARDACDELISFGPQTMAHQLARIVLMEQLFRSAKILAGEPYHC